MLHTIQADFYRLFRSKGFWITEALLALNVLFGTLFGASGHVGVQNGNSMVGPASSAWTGFGALGLYSNSMSMTVLFTLVAVSLVLGVDLTQKLYKNNLTAGVSRTGYYFAKTAVVMAISLFQIALSYTLVFITGTLFHGLGTAPDHFIGDFAVTVLVQLLCTLAWISIVSFILHLTHSISAAFVAFILGNVLLSMPMVFFPNIELFRYFSLDFGYAMIENTKFATNISLVALTFTLVFTFLGLSVFRKKNL
ncbi:hypothetical protein STRDD10_00993 [Streptococcus sp. DD10]|uniref:ABC transporter permease n=1 Tax=Streptococcus sp. DD10 TaxID=1777878 RepID=UPI0007999C51|nr:ABC transporter permease [Streptococcus sp. DD10]KXT74372.1 hypothetical protein STRDD10_00993 [Streptococcus sp. DD10]